MTKLAEQFKGAQTIYRDKEGKKIDILHDIETKKQELLRKNQERVYFIEMISITNVAVGQIKEWGGGIVQKKEAENRMRYIRTIPCLVNILILQRELQAMKAEGFAQYSLSKEQDINLMEKQRFEDPMNRIIKVQIKALM